MFTCSSSRPSGCFSVPTTGHCSPGDWIVPSKIKWDLTNGPLRKLRSSYSILRFRGLFSGSCWRFLGIDSPCWECCFSYTLVLTDQEIGYCTFPQKFNPDLWSKKMDKLNLVICCTISSHISYHIISYHVMSCHIISYHCTYHGIWQNYFVVASKPFSLIRAKTGGAYHSCCGLTIFFPTPGKEILCEQKTTPNTPARDFPLPRTQLTSFLGGWPSILWVKPSKI